MVDETGQIAVDHAAGVGVGQRRANLLEDRQEPREVSGEPGRVSAGSRAEEPSTPSPRVVRALRPGRDLPAPDLGVVRSTAAVEPDLPATQSAR
jgi:hypothetical protein